jgi:anti-anti-sigma factor
MVARRRSAFAAAFRRDGARAVLQMEGELDYAYEAQARAEVQAALDREGSELVLDLRGLTFLDVRGVHVLLDARAACRARHRRLLIVPAAEPVQRILRICGVDRSFELVEAGEHPPRGA